MSKVKVENMEIFTQHEATNYGSSYHPAIRSSKLGFGEKWWTVISLGCLPLICAAVFAVQGSPRVLQWIIKIFSSLF